jgi:hypothetical protein
MTRYSNDGTYAYDEIIELEEMDSPTYQPKETLEEKFYKLDRINWNWDEYRKNMAQIAKKHFQENPGLLSVLKILGEQQ